MLACVCVCALALRVWPRTLHPLTPPHSLNSSSCPLLCCVVLRLAVAIAAIAAAPAAEAVANPCVGYTGCVQNGIRTAFCVAVRDGNGRVTTGCKCTFSSSGLYAYREGYGCTEGGELFLISDKLFAVTAHGC